MISIKRFCAMSAIAVLASGAAVVRAAPPTVTPSPGYDARLQEQHAASTVYVPVAPAPVYRHRVKRRH